MSDSEKNFALREGGSVDSEDDYFKAHPTKDRFDFRQMFGEGFARGWDAALVAAPSQERIQALELEVQQLSEQAAGLRGALIEIVGMPTSHATVPVRDYAMQDIAKAALAGTAPAPMPSPTPQADSTQSPAPEVGRVYLVATGEIHEGEETYTRHDNAPPPLCDSECLYTAPQADSQPAVAQRAPILAYPPLPQGWPALFRCDSCDGNGEVGEPMCMGHFQPPERARCPDCDGRGWSREEDAFSADHMRAYVDADRAARAPADSVPAQAGAVPLTDEQLYEERRTASLQLFGLAQQWADNEIHSYQFTSEAEKIVDAVARRVEAAHGIVGGQHEHE